MEDIKPKKERKFLKAVGKVAGILLQEFVLGLGRKFIDKKIDRIGNKRQTLLIFLALFCNIAYASIDSIPYPITGNKQRLGWQTSGNGLVWRGLSADTITKPTNYVDKNVKAYLILDSVRGTIFVWRQTYWDSIKVNTRLMPFDSITFITAKDGTVGVGEVEYNDTQGSLIQGLKGGNVTNVIGQQLHQRVNNRTGAPLAKGDVVYLSGSQGNRITVSKALATSDPTSANTFGIVAESIADNQSGYIITEGLITNLNTSALTQDSAVYLSGTTAGALTSIKPQAPIHGVYIGVCVKSNAGSGEIFVKIRNGQELDELHDVQITSPVNNASLYYKSSDGLWRDTTAALLVSDTAAMLANYSLKGYVDSIAQNFQDSIDEITNGYFKQEFISVTKDTLNWTKPVQLPIGGSNLLLVYRNGQMINDAQYSVIDTNKVKINSGSYKLGENYTVVYVKGGGGSGSGGVPFDTSVLNLQARLDLKLNISDTAAMLANYATKAYADTTGRFYARQDFSNVSSSTLTWTQSDTLVTGGVNVVQVYRNGQILLPSQYTIPTSTSVIIAATSYKAGENYTVIFPRGGGAGSGGGSGSLTSIYAGTGITVSPNPITTTGTVSADLTVMMELTDTASLSNRINLKLNSSDTASLSNRINAKLNISDTLSMLSPYFRDADTSLLNLTSRFALKLNATDTASLSNRINAKGTGTVTSVASGYGITGGTITSTGTLRLDSATVYNYIRDSIVDVQIGNDTIKILKQEYNNVTSDTLTWTITSKFPIQLRAYILLFRNGQLLINDQYSIIDTNKIKVAATSYKLGENYTVVTVSGIGSAGISQTGNPIYPDAGIALSTGSTWASSIPNNSTNWNTAYTDRLKWDGGSSGLVAATGRTSLGGTTIGQSMFTLTNPSATTFPRFNDDNSITARSAANFRSDIGAGTVSSVTVAAGTPLSITNTTTTPTIELLSATSGRNGYLTSTDWTTFNNKQSQINGTGFVKASGTSITYDNSTYLTTSLATTTYLAKSDTASMLTPYFRDADTSQLNLTSRFATKLNISDTSSMLTNYLRTGVAASTYLPYTGGTLSGSILNSWTNAYSSAPRNDGAVRRTYTQNLYSANGGTTDRVTHYYTFSSDECCASAPVTMYYGRFNGFYNQANIIYDASIYYHNNNQFYYRAFSEPENKVTFSIKPSNTVNSISGTKADLYLSGDAQIDRSLSIGTTLGVTGATTLTGALTVNNATVLNENSGDNDTRIESDGNANMVFVDASINRVGIGTGSPSKTLDVNGTLNVSSEITGNSFKKAGGTQYEFLKADGTIDNNDYLTTSSAGLNYYPKSGGTISGSVTINSTLAVTGAITEGGNNVMTNLDTVSLSSRIDGKVGLTGNETVAGNKTLSGNTTMSGTVTMSSTSATPTGLLGINASNVIGDVTTVEQTGIFARGVITNQTTSSGGVVTFTHGLSWTPAIAFANLPDSNTNIVNVALIDATYILFVVRDGATNNVLNTQNVPAIQWFAIK